MKTPILLSFLLAASLSMAAQKYSEPSATTPTVMPTPPAAADPNHPVSSVPGETKAERDARMAWWRDAKFGMFVHWGVYSVPAGYYKGQPVKGIGEWIMNKGKIPMADYQAFAKDFTADKFDAAQFVATAKNAGMKYIVITAKHHDGFAMFDTKVNGWNIVEATPFKRDPLKELAEECRKQGVKLGFYYSRRRTGITAVRRPGEMGQGPGTRHGRLHRPHRHSPDQGNPLQLRFRHPCRCLVGHTDRHERRACCPDRRCHPETPSQASFRTTASAAAPRGTQRPPSNTFHRRDIPAAIGRPA